VTDGLRASSHELRTPINHILSYARLVREEAAELGSPDLLPGLESIQAAGQQALALVDALLAATPAAGGMTHAQARASLRALAVRLAEQVARLRAEAAGAGRGGVADDLGRIEDAARRMLPLLDGPLVPPAAAVEPSGSEPSLRATGPIAAVSSLPRRDDPSVAPAPAPEDDLPPVAPATLLVVDDNEGNRDVLSRSLARLGYAVLLAEDGRQALDVLAAEDVDLVLLDIMMPELDGYGVLERRRADPRLRDIPCIVISATGDEAGAIRCIELGAEDYLHKPFDPVLLRARIGACLEKKRLHDQERRHLATIRAQAEELAEWNRALERRVAEQVARLERVGRLRRFLPPQLAATIVDSGDESLLESHRRQIAVVFCDLRGFTPFAEATEPEEVMDALAEYHAAMGEVISRHEGTVEHFAGDGLMVIFNDPLPCPDPQARAARMALAMRDRMAELSEVWRRRGHALGFGAGIAHGYATLGQIGFEGRLHYAAIGSVVNLAARLCGEAKDGQVLASRRVATAVDDVAELRPIGELALKGIRDPVRAYEVLRLRADAAPEDQPSPSPTPASG